MKGNTELKVPNTTENPITKAIREKTSELLNMTDKFATSNNVQHDEFKFIQKASTSYEDVYIVMSLLSLIMMGLNFCILLRLSSYFGVLANKMDHFKYVEEDLVKIA